ncbi:MAG: FAD-binding oxidoreductase [Gammaproteobacteria bacterium]|nr:FAD-binding oxidoreductase [Gammaproteobacteria bacterium]MBI5617379.1 FAD-binding oxidoreductase [Gammaproteobacteria bacterium]
MSELIAEFRAIVGAAGVLTGDDVGNRTIHVWRQDPIRAKCIVRPASTEEVSAILKLCNARGQRVVPHGGLTGLVQGCNCSPDDVVLSLERMNRIEDLDTAGRTMTVQAGVPLEKLQQEAERNGLMFPLDLGARGSCQIGGNVSTNAGGNRVIRFGMTRENVLGLEAVLADGTIITALNDMLKNNAGYDLKQLFIGTEGTLGIVTRVVIRLREATHGAHTAFVGCTDFPQVARFLKYIDRELAGSLCAFEVMWKDYFELVTTPPATNVRPVPLDYEIYILTESLATAHASASEHFEAVMAQALEDGIIADAAVAKSENDRRAMWRIRDSVDQFFRFGPAFLYDVSLGIRYMDEYVREVKTRLDARFPDHHCFTLGHIGDGNIHFAINVAKEHDQDMHRAVNECVYEPLAPFNGSISAEHGIGTEKKAYLRLSRSEAEVELMRRLKRALDPNGILNPGKVFD